MSSDALTTARAAGRRAGSAARGEGRVDRRTGGTVVALRRETFPHLTRICAVFASIDVDIRAILADGVRASRDLPAALRMQAALAGIPSIRAVDDDVAVTVRRSARAAGAGGTVAAGDEDGDNQRKQGNAHQHRSHEFPQ